MLIQRVIQNINRRKRANRFGFAFSRLKDFSVPAQIRINTKHIDLRYPDEPGVWSAFVEIFLEDGYCLEQFRSGSIKRIADVGANIGFFSVCARHYFPTASIVAYEPNFQLEKYLSHHLQQVNATYHLEAVGRDNSMVSLQFSNNDSIMTTVAESAASDIRQVSIAAVLQEAGGKIDLLKLDCEGAEWQILEDHESMQRVENLVMEYHLFGKPGSTENDIRQLVIENGFSIVKMRADKGFGFIMAVRDK